jgi:hypothetical protein
VNTGKGRSKRPRVARTAGPAKVRLPPPPLPRDRMPAPPAEGPEVAPEHVQVEVAHDERPRPQRRPAPAPAPAPPECRGRPGDRTARRGPSNRELLRRALSSPEAARQAFLLKEVLGPPVSMRTGTDDRPN